VSRRSGSWRPRDERKDRVTAQAEPDVTLSGVTLGRETENAVLVTVKDQKDPIWMPLSQVTKITKAGGAMADSITVTAWIAKQKGLA
jgi:hypothetical protein